MTKDTAPFSYIFAATLNLTFTLPLHPGSAARSTSSAHLTLAL